MATFRFSGRNADGEKADGIIEAGSVDGVVAELRTRRITPLTIEPHTGSTVTDPLAVIRERLRRKRVDIEELIIFCRQMYSLSKAGVPIIRAIAGLGESNRNLYFREVLQSLRASMEGGMNMATALHAHPKVFNNL